MAKEGVAVVVVPFPAQGHLNQFLHFPLNLSTTSLQLLQQSHGHGQLSVHYACSASHIRQAKSRIHGWDANSAADRLIHFHELIPSPSFISLSLRCKQLEHLNPPAPSTTTQPRAIDILRTPLEDCFPVEFWEFVLRNRFEVRSHAGDLINTCRGIEAEFLDLLAEEPYLRDKKLFTVGPLCPTTSVVVESGSGSGEGAQRHECCLEWLDKQPPASVVYVSFGSTCTISDEQVHELALGL